MHQHGFTIDLYEARKVEFTFDRIVMVKTNTDSGGHPSVRRHAKAAGRFLPCRFPARPVAGKDLPSPTRSASENPLHRSNR
jgi:hypothetical protein